MSITAVMAAARVAGDAAVADVGGRRACRVVEQVAQRGDRVLGPGEALLQPAEVRGDQVVAGRDVGAARMPRIPSIGMSSSRNRRMTCAVGIWSVV